MLEFVICEDDVELVKKLKCIISEVITTTEYKKDFIVFDDYNEDFKDYVINNKKSVIYILNAELYSDSGIDMAKFIRTIDKNSIIIFLALYHDSVNLIYKEALNVLTIVSKSDRYKKNLVLAIKESISYLMPKNDILNFSDMGNDYNIYAMDILYIKKDGRKTIIKTYSKEYDVYMALGNLKKCLPSYFKQSHRACIINTNRVTKINLVKKEISFDTGEIIDYLGDKYKMEFKSEMY